MDPEVGMVVVAWVIVTVGSLLVDSVSRLRAERGLNLRFIGV